MAIVETPPLLLLGTRQEYFDRIRLEYATSITLPEGGEVLFYLNYDKNCDHFICGSKSSNVNSFRAQRILWMRFVLENQNVRTVVKSVANGNILFCCEELSYVVVCNSIGGRRLKCFTQYILSKDAFKKFSDTTQYQPHII